MNNSLSSSKGSAGPIVRYDPLTHYIQEIRKYPLLTREREHELALRFWKYRDTEAAFLLITSNLLLVVKLVMDLRIKQMQILDLIQEGNIGLLEALKRFDPFRDVRFSTYASWWIKAYVFKFLLDNWGIVKIGTTNKKRRLFFNLRKEQARLESMGIYPGTKLLAERLGADEKDIIEMAQHIGHADVSLESSDDEGTGSPLIDLLADKGLTAEDQTVRGQFNEILSKKIEEFKKGLSERERVILTERLLAEKPVTLQEIGSRFNKTREAIRYTENRIVDRLKSFLMKEIPDLKLHLSSLKD